jgi:hypothetical protein
MSGGGWDIDGDRGMAKVEGGGLSRRGIVSGGGLE